MMIKIKNNENLNRDKKMTYEIKTFKAGTIARDNQTDETFILNQDVQAVQENDVAYRIRSLMYGAKSFDSHWIYERDNDK